MADQGQGNISAAIFMDDIRSNMGGICNYKPKDANDKWIYVEVAVSNSSSDLISAYTRYLGSGTSITTSDKIHWIAIKNTSTTPTDGIAIRLDAGTVAWDSSNAIIIGSGEMIILKIPNQTIASVHAISVTMDGTYGYPTGTHSGTVNAQIAAIMDDV